MKMKFKQIDLEPESNWYKRTFLTKHAKRTVLLIVIGAIVGCLYFVFVPGNQMEIIVANEVIKSMLMGGFFGFFITNSPCARGKC